MLSGILATKLHMPPTPGGIVRRPRLVERLEAGLDRKLTLVSAPAGFGKTTVLSEWLAGNHRRVAWVSLDEGDNDPTRFWSYFIAALQTIRPEVGDAELKILHSRRPSHLEAVLTTLINEMVDGSGSASGDDTYRDRCVIVLDDYHVVEAQAIHKSVSFLLEHLPSSLHIVVASRSDPPLPVARLRARGQLSEFRAADLRFTGDEASQFLRQARGLELSDEDVAALETRTEGWIASLQMAAISMQGRSDLSDYVAAFSGSHRHILDYLTEEVLQRQDESTQSFLMETSILDHLSGPLCDAVTGRGDGQEVLRGLESANLFLVSLDDDRRWYRYHRLFADLLRQRLEQAHPESLPALHARASQWCEANGLAAAAIEHALLARDFDRAAGLIENAAESALMRGELSTLLNWVEALPNDSVLKRPRLCAFHAGVLLWVGRSLDAIESRLRDAADGDISGTGSGEVAVFRSLLAVMKGDARQSSDLARRAVQLLPGDSTFLRNVVLCNRGLVKILEGDVAGAIETFSEAASMGEKTGSPMLTFMALRRLAELHMMSGELLQAKALYQRLLELAVDQRGQLLPFAGLGLMGLGDLERQWNDLEAAARYLTEGIALTTKWHRGAGIFGLLTLARVEQARGHLDAASELIREARQEAVEFDATEMDDILVAMYQARLWLAQGNLEAALSWTTDRGLDRGSADGDRAQDGCGGSPSGYLTEIERMMLARVRIAQGQPEQALDILHPLLETAERLERFGDCIEILALQALAFQIQGDTERALASLDNALSLAEPNGYIRVFIDEGEPMARLLRLAASRGIKHTYVNKLLDALGGSAQEAEARAEGARAVDKCQVAPLVEGLSERELEVLTLLEGGRSNQEIADELVLAVGTVKKHIYNIYGKLGVDRRTQAVARARELGLI